MDLMTYKIAEVHKRVCIYTYKHFILGTKCIFRLTIFNMFQLLTKDRNMYEMFQYVWLKTMTDIILYVTVYSDSVNSPGFCFPVLSENLKPKTWLGCNSYTINDLGN